jgi:hypothetical protein
MWCIKEWYTKLIVVSTKVATYSVNFLIYIDLKIVSFLRNVIRRNFMNARKQSGTKSVIDGGNDNLHVFVVGCRSFLKL